MDDASPDDIKPAGGRTHAVEVERLLHDREQLLRETYAFRDEMRERFAREEAALREQIKTRFRIFGWTGFFAFVAGMAGLFFTTQKVQDAFRQTLEARLEAEFATERIVGHIHASAERAAERLAREQLSPQMAQAREEIGALQSATREALRPTLALARIATLQGHAATGSRGPLDELRAMTLEGGDPDLQAAAGGAYASVLKINRDMVLRGDLPIEAMVDGVLVRDADLPEEELLRFLVSQESPVERGQAARYVMHKQLICAAPILARLLELEGMLSALDVEADSLRSLVVLAGLTPPERKWFDPYDVKPLIGWWSQQAVLFSPCITNFPPEDWSWLDVSPEQQMPMVPSSDS